MRPLPDGAELGAGLDALRDRGRIAPRPWFRRILEASAEALRARLRDNLPAADEEWDPRASIPWGPPPALRPGAFLALPPPAPSPASDGNPGIR